MNINPRIAGAAIIGIAIIIATWVYVNGTQFQSIATPGAVVIYNRNTGAIVWPERLAHTSN